MVSVVASAGCSPAGGGGDTSAGGKGLPANATKAEFQAAFADIDPIEIRLQTLDAQGVGGGVPAENYAKTVEEWSDGKIKFEIGYSASFVPTVPSLHTALADGRLDMAVTIPSYTPDVFPEMNALATASTIGDVKFNSYLSSPAWMSHEALNNEDVQASFEAEGIFPLIPVAPDVASSYIWCNDPIESSTGLAGRLAAVSGTGKTAAAVALGMEPVSMPSLEQYEGLERGVIDCVVAGAAAITTNGTVPLLPYVAADDRVGMPQQYTGLYVGLEKWNSLPLVAQQLLHDKLDEWIADYVPANLKKSVGAYKGIGKVTTFTDASVKAVKESNQGLLDKLTADGYDVKKFTEMSDEFRAKVDALHPDASLIPFTLNTDLNTLDLSDYADMWATDVLSDHRPK